MRYACPVCGAHGSAEFFSADAKAREFSRRMGRVPSELGDPLLHYLGLFRPGKNALSWSRAITLVDELLPMIEGNHVRRNGRDWPTTTGQWRSALLQMVEARARLRLPLKSHGYLLEILAGEAQALDAKAEAERNALVQTRRHQGGDTAPVSDVLHRTWIAAENRVRAREGKPPLSPEEERAFLANH